MLVVHIAVKELNFVSITIILLFDMLNINVINVQNKMKNVYKRVFMKIMIRSVCKLREEKSLFINTCSS